MFSRITCSVLLARILILIKSYITTVSSISRNEKINENMICHLRVFPPSSLDLQAKNVRVVTLVVNFNGCLRTNRSSEKCVGHKYCAHSENSRSNVLYKRLR